MATLDVAHVDYARREYRSVMSEDATVKTKYPLSAELEYNTFIKSEGNATSFGTYILNLRKVSRQTWQCLISNTGYAFEIGDTITLFSPRFGMGTGKNFIVKSLRRSANTNFLEVALFGPQ